VNTEMLPIESKMMLRLPIQAAPVERTVVPSALAGGVGVEASQWWKPLLQHAPDIISGIASLF
jgi:hypothetical protein